MLRKEPHLRLNIDAGFLGGQYVTDLGGDYAKRVRRSDRHDAKVGIFGFILALIGGVWLFWFRV